MFDWKGKSGAVTNLVDGQLHAEIRYLPFGGLRLMLDGTGVCGEAVGR